MWLSQNLAEFKILRFFFSLTGHFLLKVYSWTTFLWLSASVSQVSFLCVCEARLLPAVFEDRHMCSLNTGNTFLSSWLYSCSSFVCLQVSTQPLLCLLALHSSCQLFEWDCSGNKTKATALEIYPKQGYLISVWVQTHAETCNFLVNFHRSNSDTEWSIKRLY